LRRVLPVFILHIFGEVSLVLFPLSNTIHIFAVLKKMVYRQLIDRKLNGCYRREEAKKVANLAVCYLKERSKSKAKDEGSGAHALTYM
jgi:hypothetical protein